MSEDRGVPKGVDCPTRANGRHRSLDRVCPPPGFPVALGRSRFSGADASGGLAALRAFAEPVHSATAGRMGHSESMSADTLSLCLGPASQWIEPLWHAENQLGRSRDSKKFIKTHLMTILSLSRCVHMNSLGGRTVSFCHCVMLSLMDTSSRRLRLAASGLARRF